MATNMTTDVNPLTALRAHCIQALMAVMRSYGRWRCPPSEASTLLQRQLSASASDIERYRRGDHLRLAVAANLLSNALPLLRMLEMGPDTSLRVELKAILDTICRGLDASDVPDDIRARFVDGAEVVEVFSIEGEPRGSRRRIAFGVNGPWTKILYSRRDRARGILGTRTSREN
jgi:hypothetical protein